MQIASISKATIVSQENNDLVNASKISNQYGSSTVSSMKEENKAGQKDTKENPKPNVFSKFINFVNCSINRVLSFIGSAVSHVKGWCKSLFTSEKPVNKKRQEQESSEVEKQNFSDQALLEQFIKAESGNLDSKLVKGFYFVLPQNLKTLLAYKVYEMEGKNSTEENFGELYVEKNMKSDVVLKAAKSVLEDLKGAQKPASKA